jgi:hypothetical protein
MITVPVYYKNNLYHTLIDDKDLNKVKDYKWRVDTYGYVIANQFDHDKKRLPNLKMHRLIVDAEENEIVDHADGNPLNNRRFNLRICTQAQNLANKRKQTYKRGASTSKYKGVYFDKQMKKWRARVTFNKKTIHVGLFVNELDAAKAYDRKAKEVFGEYALTNKTLNNRKTD